MSRLITGLQAVREAIRVHGGALESVLVEQDGGPQIEAVARFAKDRGANVTAVPRRELDRISKGARHQGAAAIAKELRLWSVDELIPLLTPASVLVALDELEDPQNFGAIIRSAVALGAQAVLWPEHRSAPLSPATFRASAGAIEHARLCRVSSLGPALEAFQSHGAHVVGLDANAPTSLRALRPEGPVVLVVGAEGKGLRKPIKRTCTTLAHLPMSGTLDSLNASVAAGIALYELSQRGAELSST